MSNRRPNTRSALKGPLAAGAATTVEDTAASRSLVRRFAGTEVGAVAPLDPA